MTDHPEQSSGAGAPTEGRFADEVAFVTGAGSGIGRATAIAFAEAGASVAAVDRDEDAAHTTVDQIEALGGTAKAIACDVTSSEQIKNAVDRTADRFGRLDYAFNNAGVELRPRPIADISEDDWDRVININLRGVFLSMKHEIPLMLIRAAARSSTRHLGPASRASLAAPPTVLRSSGSSASPSAPLSTTPPRVSGSTPSARA